MEGYKKVTTVEANGGGGVTFFVRDTEAEAGESAGPTFDVVLDCCDLKQDFTLKVCACNT